MSRLEAQPKPAGTYDEAVERVKALQTRDDKRVNPVARTLLLTHEKRTEYAAVLFHGLTNCPAQFRALAHQFYAQGYNVLVPRVPYHGLTDRLNTDIAKLTAEDLARATDDAVDIARGLGERVVVAGLSMGGVMAAWAGQGRSDVERAAVISPAFSALDKSMLWANLVSRAAMVLPNRFIWWNPEDKEGRVGPPHAYPQFSTRALAAVFRLGAWVYGRAAHEKPKAEAIQVFFNPNDHSISNPATRQVIERWKAQGAFVTEHTFNGTRVGHDVIDPTQPDQEIERVYPVLVESVCGVAAP